MEELGIGAGEGVDSVGAALRAAREARGMTVASIAERTRVPIRHLQAIEASSFAELPAITYSAGFVKVYAERVGLDGAEMSRRFRGEVQALTQAEERYEPYEPADPARVPPRALAIVGVALAVLLAVGFLLWRGLPGQDELSRIAAGGDRTPAIAAASTTPRPTPATAAAAVPDSAPVVLAADRDVWMQVKDGQRMLFNGVLAAGKSFAVPADAADPRIQTGRPEGLAVTVAGRPVAALGAEATLVKDLSLRGPALAARPALPAPVPAPATFAPPAPAPSSG